LHYRRHKNLQGQGAAGSLSSRADKPDFSGYHGQVLSYRHAFHAGNPADVLKHMILIFCLDYLGQKEKPYLCVDTHAGAGHYSLTKGYGAWNREWAGGIGRLLNLAGQKSGTGDSLPPLAARYLELITAQGPEDYPGSPGIIGKLLRARDRAVCFELHPADFALLENRFGGDRRFDLRREDGFSGLRSLLPPVSRRGCIFIDPPYEKAEEYDTLPAVLTGALRRFPGGLYILWYPLLGPSRRGGGSPGEGREGRNRKERLSRELPETLMALFGGNRCRVDLETGGTGEGNLYGSGLVIYNPPWTLKAALEADLPILARLLGFRISGITWEACNRQGSAVS
jgi:23S rRNA (adenine2030-N6)-methyltransferase